MYHMCGTFGVAFKLNPHPRHQHCTDEAQKAKTVLSAVIYIFIIIIFLTLDFYYNCSFNARAYFERALVLLGVYVGK